MCHDISGHGFDYSFGVIKTRRVGRIKIIKGISYVGSFIASNTMIVMYRGYGQDHLFW